MQGTFDVLVTTYEMLTAEQSMLANRFHFRYMVLDEAQRVKNDSSLVSQAVRRIRTTASLLLTGTPLQNNLHELRALVSVLFQDVLEAAGAEKMEVDADAAFGDDSAVSAARALLQPLHAPPHQGRGARQGSAPKDRDGRQGAPLRCAEAVVQDPTRG